MTTVADICERDRISSLDIIKVDVEGSEILALLGAEKLFRSLSVGTVQVEYNVTWLREGRRPKDLFEFVNDLRYVLLATSPFGFIYYPKYVEGLDYFRMRNVILWREDPCATAASNRSYQVEHVSSGVGIVPHLPRRS